ncbi:hypothetical protein AK830_g5607 [Neonectria ditissima]|uniref:Uncharacterized protein n=1 Tax=Neonectria ditissima TaxID=78410 RepID=A0A0P7BKH0_9HYPO|nr:hypothetical protein AK830_g5607 [Neonectria ditissima]
MDLSNRCQAWTQTHPDPQREACWGLMGKPHDALHQVLNAVTVDPVSYVLLGRDGEPHSLRKWAAPHNRENHTGYFMPWCARWTFMIESLGMTKLEVLHSDLHMKIPGTSKPASINHVIPFFNGMKVAWEELRHEAVCQCAACPFVLLIGTVEQLERCAQRGWLSSVSLEYNLAHPEESGPSPPANCPTVQLSKVANQHSDPPSRRFSAADTN